MLVSAGLPKPVQGWSRDTRRTMRLGLCCSLWFNGAASSELLNAVVVSLFLSSENLGYYQEYIYLQKCFKVTVLTLSPLVKFGFV